MALQTKPTQTIENPCIGCWMTGCPRTDEYVQMCTDIIRDSNPE